MEEATPTLKELPELKTVLSDNTAPLAQCADRIQQTATGGERALNPLDLMVELKRAKAFIDALESTIRPQANIEFEKLKAEQPDKKQWAVHGGLAIVKSTSPRASWQFPEHINEADRKLREAKKSAQEDGSAVKLEPTIDPAASTIFAVSLSEKFGS